MSDLLSRLKLYEDKLKKKMSGKYGASIRPTNYSNLYVVNWGDDNSFCLMRKNSEKILGRNLPIIFTPIQAYKLIGELDDREKMEEAELLLDTSTNEKLFESMKGLFENPYIESGTALVKAMALIKHTPDEDQELGITSIRNEELLGETFYGFLNERQELLSNLNSLDMYFLQYLNILVLRRNKFCSPLTTEDLLLMIFIDELGIRSLKEIESIESSICYLLYKKQWISNYRKSNTKKICESMRLKYIEKIANYSSFNKSLREYLEENGGFNGELWSSYEEFMHDEWLDDDFVKKFYLSHEQKLYSTFRDTALQKTKKQLL